MTLRIAALAGCLAVLTLGLTVVAPRLADEGAAPAQQPVGASSAAPTPAGELDDAHDHHSDPVDVDGLLATDTQGLRFCATASMQPYDGALQQIADAGAGEAATRFTTCLLETILYHAPDSSVAQLNTHHDHFTACFSELTAARPADPAQAADIVAACVATGAH